MKNFILSLLIALSLTLSAKAETTITAFTGAVTNFAVAGPIKLLSLTVISTATTNAPIDVYDSPNAFTTNWYGAYTNYVRSVVTTNLLYTNIFGVASTNTYPVIVNATNTAAGAMRTREKIISVYAISNSSVTVSFDSRYIAYGLLYSNIGALGAGGTISVVATYDELK